MTRRTNVRRRTLLSALGTVTSASVVGCVANPDDSDSPASTATPTETPGGTDERTADDRPTDDRSADEEEGTGGSDRPEFDPASDEPAWTLSVGDRDAVAFPENAEPIRARVWNDGPERDVRISVVRDGDADSPLHLESVSLAADAFLTVTFEEPGSYDLSVGVDGDEPTSVAAYDRRLFDCNDTITTVQVADDGSVSASTESTEIGCPRPTVADVEFEQGRGDCGGEQSATVSTDRDRVVVEGRVVTSVPCYDLRLEAADYDPDADRLTVDVAPDERHDGVCTECIGEVPYEAIVAFEHDFPATVRVRHREDGELVTVATN